MDPSIYDSANAIAILLPYIKKGAEEFARVAGENAAEKAKSLLNTLKARWKGDKEATENLERFEEKPERYQFVLKDILKEKLAEDKDLAADLAEILNALGPTLDVIIKMKEAENVTGVKIGEFTDGKISSKIDIEKGKNIRGAEIDYLGKKKPKK